MKRITKYFLAVVIIFLWLALFYFQFDRPYLSQIAHNLSPSFLITTLGHALLYLAWISIPLLVLIIVKGRFFCWRLCPIGLLQEISPGKGKVKYSRFNLYLYLFLIAFSFWGLNLIAVFDPLVVLNRAVVSLQYRFLGSFIYFLPLAVILILNAFGKRLWCWKLCPLGALVDGITFIKQKARRKKNFDIEKRKTLYMLGSGLIAGFLVRRYNYRLSPLSRYLIRPPGVLPENEFTNRCIRCGSCIAICLTGGLRPTLLEAGLEGIYTPRLIPKLGECDEFCNRCGQVCPTQAIRNMPLVEKRNLKIGTARVARGRCIAWSNDQLCLVCKEFCPYLAVDTSYNDSGTPCPVVISGRCRGCGLCQKECRAKPRAAITVSGVGMKQKNIT